MQKNDDPVAAPSAPVSPEGKVPSSTSGSLIAKAYEKKSALPSEESINGYIRRSVKMNAGMPDLELFKEGKSLEEKKGLEKEVLLKNFSEKKSKLSERKQNLLDQMLANCEQTEKTPRYSKDGESEVGTTQEIEVVKKMTSIAGIS